MNQRLLDRRQFGRQVVAEALGTGFLVVAVVGSGIAANLMFALPAVTISTHERVGTVVWRASCGLMLVIFGLVRSGRIEAIAYGVGGYVTAAYWFASSTSFAHPAVTVARTLSDTFAGIAPSSAPMFVLTQLVGAALAWAGIGLLHPTPAADAARLI